MLPGLTPTRKNYKHHQHILAVATVSLGVPGTNILDDFGQVAYSLWIWVFSLVK